MLSRMGWDCPRGLLWHSPGRPGMSPCPSAPCRCRSCSRYRSPLSHSACAASRTSHASKTGWCSWGPASPSPSSPSRWRDEGTAPASGSVGDDDGGGDVDDDDSGGGCALSATLLRSSSAPVGAPCSSWTSRASCGRPSAEPRSPPAAAWGVRRYSCTSSLRAFPCFLSFLDVASQLHLLHILLLTRLLTQQQQCEDRFSMCGSDHKWPFLLSLDSLPFDYFFTFFLDLWLRLVHSLLCLPLQQQLACLLGSLSRPRQSR